nr:hypothetical protein [Treponema denticola]
MLNYVWKSTQICNTQEKVITIFDTTMDDGKNIDARVFVINKKDKVLKISIFFLCKSDDITDTHVNWVLGDITEQIGYDPNTTKRMMHWVAHYVDKFPEYVDEYYYQ